LLFNLYTRDRICEFVASASIIIIRSGLLCWTTLCVLVRSVNMAGYVDSGCWLKQLRYA